MVERYFTTFRPELRAFLPPQFANVLEVGCAAGGFTRSHLSGATERWGIEPDAGAAAEAKPHFTRLLIGTYDMVAADLPAHHFDLIICNDVIEHMADHDRFLQVIKEKLKPGGYLVGSVPNVRHFTALVKLLLLKDWPYAADGILDRTHLRFFTEKSLRRAFRANGYAVERLEGIRSIIRAGITGLSGARNLAARAAAALLVGLSLGSWADTQYPQFGFRVRLHG